MCLIFGYPYGSRRQKPLSLADAGTPEREILTHLAEVYALEEKDTATLQDALMAVAREMVSDNLEEYLDGLEYAVEGTYLEDLDEVTIRSDFRQLATDSVYYLLSRRCGLDPMELLEEEGLHAYHRL